RRRRRTASRWWPSACSGLRWAFAFLLEVAAARLLCLQPVGARLRGDMLVAVEVGEDRLFADDRRLAGNDEDGDRLAAGALAEQDALRIVDGHLADEVVDAELGQPLPH